MRKRASVVGGGPVHLPGAELREVNMNQNAEFELFRALGDASRWALVARLGQAREAQTVTEMAEACGMHLSGVSRHLAQLERAGAVSRIKDGREVRYQLRAADVATELRRFAAVLDAGRPASPRPLPAAERATPAPVWAPIDED